MVTNVDAVIFKVQRFSLHDGPGIRTTVFFKGCPLRCLWCCNPESWKSKPELLVYANRCHKFGKCINKCSKEAISLPSRLVAVDRAKCDDCLECVAVCPSGALEAVGKTVTLPELMSEVRRDRLFYENSGGGVTASGGEPLSQSFFVEQFFEVCKEEAISIALDTSGYAPRDCLKRVLKYTDLVLFDVKHMDCEEHRKLTGVGNELILANLELAASRVRTWLRFPLIPGYNDSLDNLDKMAQLASRVAVEKISVLPYHSYSGR